MVHYIRFLKTPLFSKKAEGHMLVNALITVTTDLGDDFFPSPLLIRATIISSEDHQNTPVNFFWGNGMRQLGISIDMKRSSYPEWPAELRLSANGADLADNLVEQTSIDIPEIISAWSESLKTGVTGYRIQRRFVLPLSPTLTIWEETRESIARHIWDAGIALVSYLATLPQVPFKSESPSSLAEILCARPSQQQLKVLELGSGCGIVGIGLAQILPDCQILLTDLPEAMEILGCNISEAKAASNSTLEKRVLDWGESVPEAIAEVQYDLVLVSDCTYNYETIPALVRTLSAMWIKSPNLSIVVSLKARHFSEATFFSMMSNAEFIIQDHVTIPVPDGQRNDDGRPHKVVDIYLYQKTSDS